MTLLDSLYHALVAYQHSDVCLGSYTAMQEISK